MKDYKHKKITYPDSIPYFKDNYSELLEGIPDHKINYAYFWEIGADHLAKMLAQHEAEWKEYLEEADDVALSNLESVELLDEEFDTEYSFDYTPRVSVSHWGLI